MLFIVDFNFISAPPPLPPKNVPLTAPNSTDDAGRISTFGHNALLPEEATIYI